MRHPHPVGCPVVELRFKITPTDQHQPLGGTDAPTVIGLPVGAEVIACAPPPPRTSAPRSHMGRGYTGTLMSGQAQHINRPKGTQYVLGDDLAKPLDSR